MAIEMGLGVSLRPHALRSLVKRNVHRWLKPLRVARWVWIVMLTLLGWLCCVNAQAADVEEPFRVMILRNTSQYLPAGILQDRGMRGAFAAKGPGRVEFFVETMDTMWFDRSEIEPEFLSLFRKKYGSRKMDLLMAAGADALDFTQRFHDVLLPGVPIVFYNVAEDAIRGRGIQPGMTGVVLRFNLPGTLDLAVRVQPDARRIVVVSGHRPMIGIGFGARAKRCGSMKVGWKCPTGPANRFNSFSKIYESCPRMRLCFISPSLAMVPDAPTRLPT
jgi:hypothetical protein